MLAKQTNQKTKKTNDDKILEELVRKARKGKKIELYLLCEKIANEVLFRTKRYMGGHRDAEDVSQEVLIKVCEKITELRNPKAFKGWLNKITINEIRRYVNKRGGDETVIGIEEIETLENTDELLLPHIFAEKEELRSIVIKYIDRLPYKQREAVVMHYFDGLSVTEIAQTMGVTQPAISKYLNLARNKLKNEMENDDSIKDVLTPFISTSMVLPISEIVTNALQLEPAATLQANSEWIAQALIRCGEYLFIGAGIGAAATATAATASAATAATATAATATAATTTTTAGVGVGGVVIGCVAACIAAAAVVFTVMTTAPPPVEPPPPIEAQGEITFIGGTYIEEYNIDINPERVQATVTSTGGETEKYNWQIVEASSGEVIYEGEGYTIDDLLVRMREENGRYGEYKLYLTYKDESGATIRVGRNFYITTNPEVLAPLLDP